MRRLVVLLLFCQIAAAAPVKFRVLDGSGAPVKDVLVIVQDLSKHEAELLRVLSDADGNGGGRDLQPGPYRVIATTPFGIWRTTIKEFVMKSTPLELVLRIQPTPTHGYGDIVVIGTTWVDVQILGPDGLPASDAELLVRDRDATLYTERWYKTDPQGRTKIEMVTDPLVLIVLYQDAIMTRDVSQRNAPIVLKFSAD
jgi:hypothetical protein